MNANFLAIDLGASSGRVILGRWDGKRFDLSELHRFPNGPVQVMGHLHWDVLRLWQEIKAGISLYAAQHKESLVGIGVDSWAVDFALLDSTGRLLGNPYHYRDRRTQGLPEQVDRYISPHEIFAQTGIQRLPINTLYQLASMRRSGDPQLDAANTFLMIPDLFHYWLTGRKVAEYTTATSTQFYDAIKQTWATELLETLGIPARILPPVIPPGTILGSLLPEVREEIGLEADAQVIASASHDTASAIAAIPDLDARSMYISSGTWSLVGVELDQPILSERARELNFTNEGGVAGTIRFLKNLGGLWLLQECRRLWQREGRDYSWPELVELAGQSAPLRSVVDPDTPDFLNPQDMRVALKAYCKRTDQPEPESVGEFVRCCLESLALKYRWVLNALEELLDRNLETIRVVGGGSQNEVLCQLTADACGRTVVAGPVEATALGNIVVQAIATGHLPDLAAGRRAIAASVHQTIYNPALSSDWDNAYSRFAKLMRSA